jgi:hypothetical protein
MSYNEYTGGGASVTGAIIFILVASEIIGMFLGI